MAVPPVQIFFGSQSGTAEGFSDELRDEAAERGIQCQVFDLASFTPEDFAACSVAVLIVSTYGDGEPTDNAVAFHNWASNPCNDGVLKGQRYCVMGLGDMNYSKFNNMGSMTDASLERLGATRFYKRGVGDDSQDIVEDWMKWKADGLWDALSQAVADAHREGPRAVVRPAVADVAVGPRKPEVHFFFGQSEEDGAAGDICEALQECSQKEGITVAATQSLEDRKAVKVLDKLPRAAVVVVVVDATLDGLCRPAQKLLRMMKLELDPNSLASKSIQFALLTVATSKCSNSASAFRDSIKKTAQPLFEAFLRAGAKPVDESILSYLDAGVENVEQKCAEFISVLKRHAAAVSSAAAQASSSSITAAAQPTAVPASATRILWTGSEAREAADALLGLWPGATCDQMSSLKILAGAAQKREQVVLAVECAEGSLSDDAMGLLTMLRAVPLPLQAQLRQLRFAMLVVAATDAGNAGERASTNSTRGELTQVVAPIEQVLIRFGGKCVASSVVDLQDTDGGKLEEAIAALQAGFTDGAPKPLVTATTTTATPTTASPTSTTTTTTAPSPVPLTSSAAVSTALQTYGTPLLKIASVGERLPAESGSVGSDVLARFYFEADKAKILKVRELRQQPNAEAGLATAEVEIEATGSLKGYGLGGTLSLVPENHPDDVTAMLALLGLTPSDLDRSITFVAAEGNDMKAKQPFPTPCTLRTALTCYCDLGKPPNKKMLQALQPKLQGSAHSCVEKLLANAEALKLLHSPALCCRMHEWWALLGVVPGSISAHDFFLTCPRQKPREFTIASSPKATPDRITLCVSMTSQQVLEAHDVVQQLCESGCLPKDAALPNRDRFFGMCSRWLTSRLKVGDTVLAKQRPSPLHLPEKDVPIIMVGAGAGVAPFRGFWEELRISKQVSAPAALFFGCRHPEQDWLYKEEMTAAVKLAAPGSLALARMQKGPKRPLQHLHTAFSRPGEGQQGKYVQDEIRAQGQTLKIWIEKCHGVIFLCGSSAMGNGVLEVLSEILEGGRETVEALRKENRIVAEMWG